MSNWRLDVRDIFENAAITALGDELGKFGAWNSQLTNEDAEETRPQLSVFFEYSQIGDGVPYLNTRDTQQAERIPVQATLHIVFDNYTDITQSYAYDYAYKVICELYGTKADRISGRIMKILEVEDTNHVSNYDYQITFAFFVQEVIGVLNNTEDANPEDGTNPDTGRRLDVVQDVGFVD